jgi:hypothetical protein
MRKNRSLKARWGMWLKGVNENLGLFEWADLFFAMSFD